MNKEDVKKIAKENLEFDELHDLYEEKIDEYEKEYKSTIYNVISSKNDDDIILSYINDGHNTKILYLKPELLVQFTTNLLNKLEKQYHYCMRALAQDGIDRVAIPYFEHMHVVVKK